MPVYSVLDRGVFDGIAFPVMECKLSGSLKEHVHEFAYSPGGPVELMARKPYVITIKSVFFDTSRVYGPDLYPKALNEIRRRFESQLIAPFEVPNLGTIRAYIKDYDAVKSGKIKNGEEVTLVFREDTTDLFSVETLLQTRGSSFNAAFEEFSADLDALNLVEPPDLFEAINQLANEIFAIFDSVRLVDAFLAAKIDGLTSIIERAMDEVELLKQPNQADFIESLKNMWAAANELKETVAGVAKLQKYTVPFDSTLSGVCMQIYGNTTRAQELLSLNLIYDPLRIEAGTILVYAPLEATA